MRLLNYDEAAALLNIPRGSLEAWVSTGRVPVPYVRLAKRTVRFPEAELLGWIVELRAQARRDYEQRKQQR